MPFPRKLLNDYEEVALDLHPHWWYFAKPVVSLVGSLALAVVVTVFTDEGSTLRRVLAFVVLGLVVLSALWVLGRWLKWWNTNFVITSDRLIFREGIIAKSGIEIPLERVNNVNFEQGILERLIGAGDLLIESGGEAGQQRFTDIRRPERVKNLIHAEMEENEHRKFGGVRAKNAVGLDVADQLEKLEGLMERGLLTRDEFEAQKRKLLGA
jgi:uncharacterized membrane protein YdbT with pleckstrin-like domain